MASDGPPTPGADRPGAAPCRRPIHHPDAIATPGDGSPAPGGLDDLVAFRPAGAIERRRGAVARLRSTTATSAGGIVVRLDGGRPSLVVGLRRRDGDRHGGTWTLPKGTPDPGETIEETAVREVEEETGLHVRIIAPLPSIDYSFVQGGARIHKTVHYFLMEAVGGDLARHDREFERVRWARFEDARSILTFDTERGLVETAAAALGAVGAAVAGAEAATGPVLGGEASAG